MKKKTSPRIGGGKQPVAGVLEVKVAYSAHDWRRAKEALGMEHGWGAGREAGDRLGQLVMEDGKLAGVLVGCAAAWHLKDRDEAVGWDAVARSGRLKLVVQLRRFLVWEEARKPNLASQCLGGRDAGTGRPMGKGAWIPSTFGRKLQQSGEPCGHGLQSDELDPGRDDEGISPRPHRR